MMQRTDIAGGSAGQTSPGNDRMCRRAASGARTDNNPSLEPLPATDATRHACRLHTPVSAIHLEP